MTVMAGLTIIFAFLDTMNNPNHDLVPFADKAGMAIPHNLSAGGMRFADTHLAPNYVPGGRGSHIYGKIEVETPLASRVD